MSAGVTHKETMSFTVIAKVSDFEVAGAHVGRRSIGEQQVATAFCGVHTGHRQCLLAQTSWSAPCWPTSTQIIGLRYFHDILFLPFVILWP